MSTTGLAIAPIHSGTDSEPVRVEGTAGWGFEAPGTWGQVSVYDQYNTLVSSTYVLENNQNYAVGIGSVEQARAGSPFTVQYVVVSEGVYYSNIGVVLYFDDNFINIPGGDWISRLRLFINL